MILQAAPFKKCTGFTLVEMMVSVSIGGLILAAMVLGAAAFQNVFFAADDYYQSTADQMRVMDYISRDIRCAISGSTANSGQTLTVNLPDYIDPATNQPRTPTVKTGTAVSFYQTGSGIVSYFGSTSDSVAITYTGSGNIITRSQTVIRGGTTSVTSAVIANNTDSLQLSDAKSSGTATNFVFGPPTVTGSVTQIDTVKTTMTFMPRFNRSNNSSSRAGTSVYQTTTVRNN